MDNYKAFNKAWFGKYQKPLIFLLNTPVLKVLTRHILRINKDCKYNEYICAIAPNYYKVLVSNDGNTVTLKIDVRTHDKFSKRIYFAFKPVWWALHYWDQFFADLFAPRLSFGFSTLTAFPDPDPETTTVDGNVGRAAGGGGQVFTALKAGAGTVANPSIASDSAAFLDATTVSSQFNSMYRGVFLFNTAAIGDSGVTAATFSMYGSSKNNGLGSPAINVIASHPASNTNLVAADYSQFDGNILGSQSYASYTAGAYNDFALNASGILVINNSGVTKLGSQLDWDTNNSFTGVWASGLNTDFECYYADTAATANDPKLVVTYTANAFTGGTVFFT